jgi:hypothetical protein
MIDVSYLHFTPLAVSLDLFRAAALTQPQSFGNAGSLKIR